MLFVTIEYLVFFVITFFIFWIVPSKLRFLVLLLASIYFYGTWSIAFILHLIIIVACNYYGMKLWEIYKKKSIFIFVIILDILNIAVFKYYYLFFDFLGRILQIDEWKISILTETLNLQGLKIFLPLGISFYTFQIMSYSYDIYRGNFKNQYTFRETLLYILFFPQLIAGPIMRPKELLPQIRNLRHLKIPERETIQNGFWLILSGVFKKIIIADNLSIVVSPLFVQPLELITTLEIWIYVFTCLMMLYADFSAYTDIARGCGKFLNIEIPINFKAPFFMISMSDFWRRWHLTFSMWIRDYIYIPLGGSRVPEVRNYFNLIVTFFLGGLWHGASYNFIIWGVLVGIILSIESFLFRRGISEIPKSLAEKIIRILIAWYLFLSSALFFFVRDFSRGIELLQKMIFWDFHFQLPDSINIIFSSFLAVIFLNYIEEYPEKFNQFKQYSFFLQMICFTILLFMLIEFSSTAKDFFYFQF